LGGEKLKTIRFHFAAFCAALCVCIHFLGATSVLSAQALDAMPGAELTSPEMQVAEVPPEPRAEDAILFDDPLPATLVSGGAGGFVVIRMVLVLALAALAIYGVVFFVKRLAKPQEKRDPHLKLLARTPLSSDTFAAVVSVGSKAWLVGGGSGALNLISEIDDAETLETLLLDDARRNAEAELKGLIDFNSLLQRLRGKPRAASSPSQAASVRKAAEGGLFADGSSLSEGLHKQRERLRGL